MKVGVLDFAVSGNYRSTKGLISLVAWELWMDPRNEYHLAKHNIDMVAKTFAFHGTELFDFRQRV